MYMDEGMDTGDIILKQEIQIGEDETTGELWNRMAIIGGNLLVETLNNISKGIAPRKKQEGNFSIAPMLDKDIAKIDWENKNAFEIKNLVRGLNPIMGAYSFINNKKVKFWKVKNIEFESFLAEHKENINIEMQQLCDLENGIVVLSNDKDGLYIKAKDGIICVLEIQGENSKRMKINDFLRGNKIELNSKFI